MVIAEENAAPAAQQSNDIDLKCAEKVTDSDNEEVIGSTESAEHKQARKVDTADAGNAGSRDFTCKPKPIKVQCDNTLLTYQQIPLYAFNSPKNPNGLSPFHPTGKTARAHAWPTSCIL